jgi:signal transduction histidine kinase
VAVSDPGGSDRVGAVVVALSVRPLERLDDLLAVAHAFDGVEVAAPAGLPPAEGEADVVQRALAPIVDNARRHARSRVWIELSAEAGHVRATVRDDGPGPDLDLAERVFEPGVRGGSGGGAGLGLPLARRLARSCGGDVLLGDGPGGRFVLVLPALSGTEPDAPAAS